VNRARRGRWTVLTEGGSFPWVLVIGGVLGGLALLWALGIYYLRRVWFFRDPVRESPRGKDILLSAADGIVVYVRPYEGGVVRAEKLGAAVEVAEITKAAERLSDDGWVVGVYMSPLDVHFNYAPADAVIEQIVHTPVQLNLPMVDLWEYIKLTYLRRAVDLFSAKYRLVNERNTIFFRSTRPGGGEIRYAAVEIADKFVNKIDCFVRAGDRVQAGQKISFIKRGSQVDMVLPRDGIRIEVTPGQRVVGGITVLARMTE
jgi:phosphatidylserine decarboxylase